MRYRRSWISLRSIQTTMFAWREYFHNLRGVGMSFSRTTCGRRKLRDRIARNLGFR